MCGGYPRDADERCISAVEEGAVDDLQDKGEVLQWEERHRGTDREDQALQGGDGKGEAGGAQVGLLLRFSCRGHKGPRARTEVPARTEPPAWIYQGAAVFPCVCP